MNLLVGGEENVKTRAVSLVLVNRRSISTRARIPHTTPRRRIAVTTAPAPIIAPSPMVMPQRCAPLRCLPRVLPRGHHRHRFGLQSATSDIARGYLSLMK